MALGLRARAAAAPPSGSCEAAASGIGRLLRRRRSSTSTLPSEALAATRSPRWFQHTCSVKKATNYDEDIESNGKEQRAFARCYEYEREYEEESERMPNLEDAAAAAIAGEQLAVAHGPEVHELVERAGSEQTAVGREGHRVDGLEVAREHLQALAALDLPEAHRRVERGGREQWLRIRVRAALTRRRPFDRVDLLGVRLQVVHRLPVLVLHRPDLHAAAASSPNITFYFRRIFCIVLLYSSNLIITFDEYQYDKRVYP